MHNSPAAHLNRYRKTNNSLSSYSSNPVMSSKFKRTRHDETTSQYLSNRLDSTLHSNTDYIETAATSSSKLVLGPSPKKTRYSTSDHFVVSSNNNDCSQTQPIWQRSVHYGPDNISYEVHSSSLLKKMTYSKYEQNAESSDNERYSRGQSNWIRKVVEDIAEEFNLSSQSVSAKRTTSDICLITPDVYYSHIGTSHSRPLDLTNNIPQHVSPTPTLISSTSNINNNVGTLHNRSQEISYASTCPSYSLVSNIHEQYNNSEHTSRAGSQDLVRPFPVRNNLIENESQFQPSELLNVTSPDKALVVIELDDYSTRENNDSRSTQMNFINELFGPINLSRPTNFSSPNSHLEPETIDVIFISGNTIRHIALVTDPHIIQMHKILQRSIANSNRSSSVHPNLIEEVDYYISTLISTILLTEANNLDILSEIGSSVLHAVHFEESIFRLIDDTSSKMPPVNTVPRIQRGHVIKKLENCVICLEENVGNVLLKPCLHYEMCFSCIKKLRKWSCPMCRSPISSISVYV